VTVVRDPARTTLIGRRFRSAKAPPFLPDIAIALDDLFG